MADAKIDFISLMQEFVAISAPSGGALRNQERGVLKAVQGQLTRLSLKDIPGDSVESYRQWLDCQTEKVLNALTVRVKPWGAIRKALNLFMRACICDHYLRSTFRLERIEALAEIPLDSVVATALKRKAGRGMLPVWPGLKWLNAEQNHRFQTFAEAYANQLGLPARVYLDNYLWLRNR